MVALGLVFIKNRMKKNEKYTKEYFIKKFEAIPEEKWCVEYFTAKYDKKCHCALGHCGETPNHIPPMARKLRELFDKKASVVSINDNKTGEYNHLGSTPKQRILNFLKQL